MTLNMDVTTLALALQPKPGLARVQAKKEGWESHLIFPRVKESVIG